MPIHIDMDQVRANQERTRAMLEPLCEQPGVDGVEARANREIVLPFGIFMAEEINRDTKPRDLAFALNAAVATMMLNLSGSIAGAEDPEGQAAWCHGFMDDLADKLSAVLSGELGPLIQHRVSPTPAGRA